MFKIWKKNIDIKEEKEEEEKNGECMWFSIGDRNDFAISFTSTALNTKQNHISILILLV